MTIGSKADTPRPEREGLSLILSGFIIPRNDERPRFCPTAIATRKREAGSDPL